MGEEHGINIDSLVFIPLVVLPPTSPLQKPGFLVWTAGASDPAAEEARFAAASPVYEDIKRAYDRSRDTVSRTDYEVDFVAAFNKLTSLGPKLNPNAYLYPQAVFSPRL